MAVVTANVLGRSPRGQQWCRAIGLRFVNFRDRVPGVAARQARFRTIQACPKDGGAPLRAHSVRQAAILPPR